MRAPLAARAYRLAPSLLMGALLVWLVAIPLAFLVLASLRPTGFPLDAGLTFDHYAEVYGSPGLWRLIGNSVVFALGSVAIALLLGGGLAWLVERTDLPGAGAVRALVILPMATPPLLMAIGWSMLLSPRAGALNLLLRDLLGLAEPPFNAYSMPAMVFVQGLSLTATAFLFLAPAFRNMDPSLEEAALASGASGWMLARRVLVPLLSPALLAAAVFLLIVGFVVFEIPGTLGMPARIFVLSSQLFYLASEAPGGLPLYGQVSALATLLLVVLLGFGLLYRRLTREAARFRTVTGKGFRPRRMALGAWRWPALGFACAYFLLAVGMPVGMLAWMSLMPYQVPPSVAALALATLENHRDFLDSPRVFEAAANTMLVAAVSATAVAILATLIAWFVVRLRVPGAAVLDALAFMPVAIPGVMMGVALIYVYLTLDPIIAIYGTVWILVVAYTTDYLSFGTRATGGVMAQLHPELEEAGRTSGAGASRVLRRITLPLMWPAIAAVWIWVLAHAMRELSIALMLQGRDNRVATTLLWDWWQGGEPTRAAAVGVWLVGALLVVMVAWQLLGSRLRRGSG
ncbi:ABC transporter permease [Falsiroseomonas oryzae]|uniref:ABC transporter permease n=1 Tax=Falsiroseomonas oryzae TaxID=2766473 RepID=UPI0022EB0DA4|nr:ABC transporter permease subunit [Roseomonas sp. MO-31]